MYRTGRDMQTDLIHYRSTYAVVVPECSFQWAQPIRSHPNTADPWDQRSKPQTGREEYFYLLDQTHQNEVLTQVP